MKRQAVKNETIMNKIEELESKIQHLISYINLKITLRDWHAVADAAMDIRELEAKIQVYKDPGVFDEQNRLRQALELCGARAGISDPAEACRLVIKTVKDTLE